MKFRTSSLLALVLFSHQNIHADDLFELPISELLKIKVQSASKKEESLLKAPIAIDVLSSEDIERSNVTNIAEALRLIPGVIVKEESNGNFDIHIRGLNSVVPGNGPVFSTNSSTLVMINNKPAYNHFFGGVYWPSLGIGLNDIKQIEVAKGAVSAMYGPNAANGIINIITKTPTSNGTKVSGHSSISNENTQRLNARADIKSDKTELSLFTNIDRRKRSSNKYYDLNSRTFRNIDDVDFLGGWGKINAITANAYPYTGDSLKEQSLGSRLAFDWNANNKTIVSYNHYRSKFHDNILDTSATTFAFFEIDGHKLNIEHEYKDYKFFYTYERANQDLSGSTLFDFKMDIHSAQLEGKHKFKNSTLSSLIFFNQSVTDSVDFLGINNKEKVENVAASTMLDYKISDKLRSLVAIRLDYFSLGYQIEPSYQLALTYTPTDRNFYWVNYGHAFRSPFVLDALSELQTAAGLNQIAEYKGDVNLKLLTIDEVQLGWRNQSHKNLSLSTHFFYRDIKNFHYIGQTGSRTQGADTIFEFEWKNLPTTVTQLGLTFSGKYNFTKSLSSLLHMTTQRTTLTDRQKIAGTGTTFDSTYNGTPAIFGGINTYWNATSKSQFSLESYFYTRHKPEYGYGFSVAASPTTNVRDTIHEKILIDLGYRFSINEVSYLKLVGKNILNQKRREFNFADETPMSFYAELALDL